MLFPKYYYKSAYSVPYRELYEKGKRAVLFDIDNTLVPHGAEADERAKMLIRNLKNIGYKICFISNNKEKRVADFNRELGCTYIYKAGKPEKKGYLSALSVLNAKPQNALFVGDQIFTDIWGANRAKIDSYLVNRIGKKEEIQIHLKRIPEALIKLSFVLFCNKKCFLKNETEK